MIIAQLTILFVFNDKLEPFPQDSTTPMSGRRSVISFLRPVRALD